MVYVIHQQSIDNNPTDEMVDWFELRTSQHISRVQQVGMKITDHPSLDDALYYHLLETHDAWTVC